MTAVRAIAVLPIALLACTPPVTPAEESKATTATAASLCRAGERVVYACKLSTKRVSVCLGTKSIHYRAANGADQDLDVSSTADWGNIHIGGNRSGAGLNQDHIRFSSRDTHYVIHAGETGSLNEQPGRRMSGLVVIEGDSAEHEIERRDCETGVPFDRDAFLAISDAAPQGWDGREADNGPFEAIY